MDAKKLTVMEILGNSPMYRNLLTIDEGDSGNGSTQSRVGQIRTAEDYGHPSAGDVVVGEDPMGPPEEADPPGEPIVIGSPPLLTPRNLLIGGVILLVAMNMAKGK